MRRNGTICHTDATLTGNGTLNTGNRNDPRPAPGADGDDVSPGGSNYPAGEWPVVARALCVYLVVAWLLVRVIKGSTPDRPPAAELVSLAVLVGFPLAALLAVRLVRATRAGRWPAVMAAVAIAAMPPVIALHWPANTDRESEIVLTPAAAGPRVLSEADIAGLHQGLKLRVRGLSLDHADEQGRFADGSEAEILIVAAVRDAPGGEELVISATLVSVEAGGVVWRSEYTGDPTDLVAIRRLLIKALTEAMSLTREGVSGGQIV